MVRILSLVLEAHEAQYIHPNINPTPTQTLPNHHPDNPSHIHPSTPIITQFKIFMPKIYTYAYSFCPSFQISSTRIFAHLFSSYLRASSFYSTINLVFIELIYYLPTTLHPHLRAQIRHKSSLN